MLKRNVIPGTEPNYIYSIIGVTLVLVLVGFFGVLLLTADQLIRALKEQVNLIIELKDDIAFESRTAFENRLERFPFVIAGSVEFVSKEEGAKGMKEEFGEDFLTLDMPNPLFDIFTFNVKSSYAHPDSLVRIRSELMDNEVVRDVFYQKNVAEIIAVNLKKFGFIALALGLFFSLVAVFLIHNTIRLALYANRFLIKNMELVGASWEFISRPFLKRSFLHGIYSGLFALIILGFIQFFAMQYLPVVLKPDDWLFFGLMSIGLIVLGTLITTGSTWFVVDKYLKMRIDEMY